MIQLSSTLIRNAYIYARANTRSPISNRYQLHYIYNHKETGLYDNITSYLSWKNIAIPRVKEGLCIRHPRSQAWDIYASETCLSKLKMEWFMDCLATAHITTEEMSKGRIKDEYAALAALKKECLMKV